MAQLYSLGGFTHRPPHEAPRRRMNTKFKTMCTLAAFIATVAQADQLVPISYTATPGETGDNGIHYIDDTGSQLTDGVVGADDWDADLGHGRGYEWVAWRTTIPTLTFTFSNTVTITAVEFDLDRYEARGVFVPTLLTVGGVPFSFTGNEFSDQTRGSLTVTGFWCGSTITIQLSEASPGRWIFLDEVRFTGAPGGCIAPPLFFAAARTNIVISWPVSATNFVLQATPSLSPPIRWETVTNPVESASVRLSVSLPLDQPTRFFRLRQSQP